MICVYIINVYFRHEVQNPRALAKRPPEIGRYRISVWEETPDAQERVNIPCLVCDTRLCQRGLIIINNKHGA